LAALDQSETWPLVYLVEQSAVKNRLFIEAIAVVVACLLGFLPQYIRTRRLEGDLHSIQLASGNAELRDLAGLAYVQASQKNYGLAAATCARFFNRCPGTRQPGGRPDGPQSPGGSHAPARQGHGGMAKGDPGVIADLQDVFARTRRATLAAGEQ
jgi:hypothetical protein